MSQPSSPLAIEPNDALRFKAIFEQSEVPTQLYTAQGRIRACNAAWYRWTRLSPKDVEALNASGYCLLEDPSLIRSGVVDSFRKALTGAAVQTSPVFYNLADHGLHDQSMWIQGNFYPIADANGTVVEVLILHHDVSALMEAKARSEAALEQAKRIAEYAPVGIQIYDAEGYSIFTNEWHHRIFGAAPPPSYCCLKDPLVEAAGLLSRIQKAFSGEPAMLPVIWYDARELTGLTAADQEYTKKLGRKCAIETHMIPVKDARGQVTNVMFVFKDVTGELFMQQEKERALKERDDAKTLIQSVLNQTHAVIYIKDLEGRFIFVNNQFCSIFDRGREQILGKMDHELFGSEVAAQFRKNDVRVLESREHVEFEEEAPHADGSRHWYLSHKFALEDSEGKLTGICGISTDITERRQLERQLSHAKRLEAVGILASGIAHNFNNLIGVVLLVADTLLIRGAEQNPEQKALIQEIKGAARSAATLTRQLLMFGRRQALEPCGVDFAEVVARVTEMLNRALGEDIRLRIEGERKCWPVSIDPSAAEQLLANLCLNARDAMPKGGELTIVLKNAPLKSGSDLWRIGAPLGECVELAVADTGHGIGAEHLDRIFEPFYSTKSEGSGWGLGLASVYGAVQAAGGDIAVKSVPGRGTTFRACFPRALGEAIPLQVPARPVFRTLRGTETVMLIEDEPILRIATASLLRDYGYTVLEAKDAETALSVWATASDRIDLVMTDIVMSGCSGLEITQSLMQARPDRELRSIFVSGHSDQKLSDYGLDRSRSAFLQKPYSATELLERLREVLEG